MSSTSDDNGPPKKKIKKSPKEKKIMYSAAICANMCMYRVYVSMPYPDYKCPSVDVIEFFHEKKDLAVAVYHALIRYHLEGYAEWSLKNYDDDFCELNKKQKEKKIEEFKNQPEKVVEDFMKHYDEYLYKEHYMSKTPEFIFEEFQLKNSTFLPEGANHDPLCKELFEKYK